MDSTQENPTSQAPQHFVERESLQLTYIMLKSYEQEVIESRTFMLKQHSKMLEDLDQNRGHFAEYPDEEKRYLEAMIYLELLTRICTTIEDFCVLCNALWGDLRSFPNSILKQPNPKSILSLFNNERWHILLRYSAISDLSMTDSDRKFLENVRKSNLKVLQGVVDIASKFMNVYWLFYTKHKHGNPLVFGRTAVDFDGEDSIFIAAFYNVKNLDQTTGMLANRSIYAKWQMLHNAIVTLSKDIVSRTLLYIELDGACITERITYFTVNQIDKDRLRKIAEICEASLVKTNIMPTLQFNFPPDAFKKHRDLYESFDSMTELVNPSGL